jgi:hypothetical protein
MTRQSVQIIEKFPFRLIAPMGALYAEVKVVMDGKEKTVRFGIFGSDLAIRNWKPDSKHLLDLIDDALSSGIFDTFEFEGIYYFSYTGSHFQQDETFPDWNNDPRVVRM